VVRVAGGQAQHEVVEGAGNVDPEGANAAGALHAQGLQDLREGVAGDEGLAREGLEQRGAQTV
jgi:hypothetical protein